MPIVSTRIDDRLIHGQVAAMWCKNLDVNRIMVVDDEANGNQLQKQLLSLACPTGMNLSILTVEKAVNNLASDKYGDDKIFMIVKGPNTLVRLLDKGFEITEVNVGNMGGSNSKKQIKTGVNVDSDDIACFRKLAEAKINVYGQSLPSDEKVSIIDLINDMKA